MIEFIELRNWKTHENTKLSFTKGTNVLIGQMGSGKSSVMDAISYALFGTFPALQRRRISTSDLIRNVPVQESYAEVRLGLSIEGNEYVVERRIELSGSSHARIFKNGSIVQSQPQRVNEYLENLLKLDYDLFSRAIYSEQNNLDYFLELRSGERKDIIDKLLGLDKFAIAEDNVVSLVNRVKEMAKQAEDSAGSFDLKKLTEQLEKAKEELKQLKDEKEKLSLKYDELKESVSKQEKKVKELLAKDSRKRELEKEFKSLEGRIALIEREAKKIEEMKIKPEELESMISSLSSKLEKARSELKTSEGLELELGRSAARLESEAKKIEEQIRERDSILKEIGERKIEEYTRRKEEKEKELEQLEKALASSKAMKDELEKHIEELSEHISKCPVCERELSDEMRLKLLEGKKKVLNKVEEEIKNGLKLVEASRKEVKQLSEELNSLLIANEKLKNYVALDEKLIKLKAELNEKEKESAIAKEKKESLSKQESELSEELVKFKERRKDIEKLNSYKKEAAELAEKMGLLKIEIEKLEREASSKLIEEEQKELTRLSSLLSSTQANLAAIEKAAGEKGKEIAEKEETIKHIQDLAKDAEKKKKAAEELAKFKNALSETQGMLRSKLINSINHIMGEIWPELYPYGDYIGIRLDASKDDYVLEVKMVRNGAEEWCAVESIASGGERSIACLAMRVAFALVLVPNLKWLILDEPTHNIDEQGIGKFARVFNETLPRIVEQIFLITHDEALKQASSSKTYLLSRDKAAHGSTVVEEL
ncbi:MAG: ATP-binding protein [Candidatus Micrarchaeia archaeon]|jgi:exonuclease SbcC